MGLGAAAQDAVPPAQTLKIATKLVVLDVGVTDRKGDPVRGLTRQDFNVFEDGKWQPIKSFEAHDGASSPGDQGNRTIIVLDELNADATEIAYSRTRLRKYLLAQPRGKLSGPVMLVAASNDGLQLVQGYTDDAAKILKALEAHSNEYPYKAARGFGEERVAETMSFLQQIALSSRGEQDRKNVLWIGKGFPNVISANLSTAEEESVERVLRQTVNMLLDARVSVTKIDPTATTTLAAADPYGFSDQGPDPYADGVSFNAVVVQTGGRLYFARNDLDREVAQSVNQGDVFYTLAYTPSADVTAGSADLYRHIRVAVDRENVTVQTKHGYYPDAGLPATTLKGELSLDLWQAATTSLAYSGIPLRLDSITRTQKPGSVSCTISVNEDALSYEPDSAGDRHADVYLVISSFSARGKVLSSFETKAVSTIKKQQASGDTGRSVQSVFRIEVPLPAQAKRMRFVMRDARTGHTGTVDAGPNMLPK